MFRRGSVFAWILSAMVIAASVAMLALGILLPVGSEQSRAPTTPDVSASKASLEKGIATRGSQLRELAAVAASPVLATISADGDPTQLLFRTIGTPRMVERRPWSSGGEIVMYAVEVETRSTPADAWSKGEALLEVIVNARGETVSTRTLTVKGADELELERAAGVR